MVAIIRKYCDTDTDIPWSSTGDINSFAHSTARKRWPVILQAAIEDVKETLVTKSGATKDEGEVIVREMTNVKDECVADAALTPLDDDNSSDIHDFNREIEVLGRPTWLNSPWLFSESYMYRRLQIIFAKSTYWKDYDIFKRQKDSTFLKSGAAVKELTLRYLNLVKEMKGAKNMSEDARKLLFTEMVEISLWGNATDLSLLTNLSLEDIQSLQGKEAIKNSQKNIVVNDTDAVWKLMKDVKGGQIDVVLDNAGFELFADLIFIAYLLASGIASTVILRPKNFGWFVSDVTPVDIESLFSMLRDPKSFDCDAESRRALDTLAAELEGHYRAGRIAVRVDAFWTTAHPFWRLPVLDSAAELYEALKNSDLVIYKGDLNYRKLTSDAHWAKTTPFVDAIGPMGRGSGLRTLALRTCKADVCVGLPSEDKERELLEADGKAWTFNGKYAVISYFDGKAK
ncbi:DUF89 domain-containing protein [Saitoella complicata NRRL Y-17804]|uniref:Sugar phosphate phosphatase n=1 Tax=Saitoella complicata (strain BCRC 22490 / CBS 7301 / JCM 7358 / NBRC 10748 / NRRL Y-17804) TaxID=698492 RepID=A0A0E9NP86_SAICN|nr:DUF89 domain-containing protein [Saitoella complicata NRRL Y-17804]ODQ56290.1 DUF89 domain-containing protein [Saitoella complicata NRRL Y-17804]GAO51481.1 hypothetical protein G7K_5581-t1 [Saitoella complicata NRRL Y-17804]